MKLQKLRIQGLRSFTRETEIDLGHLGEQGLFAIFGPTGVGKSTILDGIFLALFGRCPRGEASECVSAGALDLAVRLELSVGRDEAPRVIAVERRFHWSRKRGADALAIGADLRGAPKHPPLRLEEKKGAGWEPMDLGGKRPDELLSEQIVRVSISDFQQAVVLPQGEFDALLRARPADRRTLVASLFRTEHLGKPLSDALKAREEAVRGEIDRLTEAEREIAVTAEEAAAAAALAEETRGLAEARGQALAEAEQIAVERRLARERCAAKEAAEQALAVASQARQARAPDRARARLGQRARGAEAALSELSRGDAAAQTADLRAMTAGAAANEAEAALRRAARALEEAAAARAAGLPEVLSQLGRARLALERGQELSRLDAERAAAEQEHRAAIEAIEAARADASAKAQAAARAAEQTRAEQAHAEAELERAAAEAERAERARDETRRAAVAAEIAAALRAGAACPVCGSQEHPAKLASGPALQTLELAERAHEAAKQLEKAAERAREGAILRAFAQADELRALTERRDALAAELTRSAMAAASRLGAAASLVAARREEIHRLLAALEPEGQHDLFAQPSTPRTAAQWISALEARSAALIASEARARAALDEAREAAERLTLDARDASARRDEAAGQLARARAAAREAMAQAGFESLDALRAARVEPAALEALIAELDRLDQEHARLEAVFAERQRDAAVLVTEEEASAAERARDEARKAAHEAGERAVQALGRRDELGRRRLRAVEIQARVALLEPRAKRIGQIQKVVASNQLSELAAERHLEAVTRGAAAILRSLSNDRYALVRTAEGAFAVADSAYGALVRPPSTLSGGETFLVSLALALSLSERIQLAGRTRFDFFFLDEGFGSLDAGTLEVALGALERLRGPHRVIGMISHVPAIEERMPRKLRVLPGRSAWVTHSPSPSPPLSPPPPSAPS